MPERLVIAVTYDPAVGYRTTGGPELPVVSALSLGGLRRRIEAALMPDEVIVVLSLDRAARLERDQRRRGGASRPTDYAPAALGERQTSPPCGGSCRHLTTARAVKGDSGSSDGRAG